MVVEVLVGRIRMLLLFQRGKPITDVYQVCNNPIGLVLGLAELI